MARPTSPPPVQPPRAQSPTPRQRLRSLFGSTSNHASTGSTGSIISRAKSPSKGFRRGRSNSPEFELVHAPSSPPVVSQLQLRPVEGSADEQVPEQDKHAFPASRETTTTSPVEHIHRPHSPPPSVARPTSPFKLHRTLSRRLSSSSGSSPSMTRRPSKTPMSPAGIGSSDLPPASSDVGAATGARPSSPFKAVEPPRPTSPFKTPSLPSFSPPGSPQRRNRPFAGVASTSRPSSPTKELLPSGAQSPRKRAVDKAMIGLPTNFKHTSSGGGGIGSTASSSDAVFLAGLASPSASGQEARRRSAALALSRPSSPVALISRPSSPSMSAADYDSAAGESLAYSLAHINSALNGSDDSGYAKSSNEPEPQQSQQSHASRLDTVKEVPSGFIQRFEKAGQTPSPSVGSRGTRADARWLFGRRDEEDSGEMERMGEGLPSSGGALASLRTSGASASSLRANSPPPLSLRASSPPPSSPTRMGRRKPVPRVAEDEEVQASSGAAADTGTVDEVPMPLTPGRIQSVTPLDESQDEPVAPPRTRAISPPAAAAASPASWDATLAEISAALQLDADTNPALVGKKQFGREELDVKW